MGKSTTSKSKKSPIKVGASAKKSGKRDGGTAKEKILKIVADSYCKEEEKCPRDRIAKLAKLSMKTVQNNATILKNDGLLCYPCKDSVALTELGVKRMGDQCKIMTPEEKRAKLVEGLKGKPLRLYELLNDGSTWSKDELALKLGFEQGKKQKGFQNLVGKWKGEGMIEYPSKDDVKLTDTWLGN